MQVGRDEHIARSSTADWDEPAARQPLPDGADPHLTDEERRERTGPAGGGPYPARDARTEPYED